MSSNTRSKVITHYDGRAGTTREQRISSKILALRKFQNWVKATLINTYAEKGAAVLDLACGKGGDLMKWSKVEISKYYGCDISKASIEDAISRARRLHGHQNYFFEVYDCFGDNVEDILPYNLRFSIVSVQFALHYSFENEERARMALHNISVRLEPGGYVIGTIPNCYYIRKIMEGNSEFKYTNGIFSIKFDSSVSPHEWSNFGLKYVFSLVDALDDCPEYVVYWKLFERLASEYDLELVYREAFHRHYHKEIQKPSSRKLFRDIVGYQDPHTPIMSVREWEVAGIYYAFAFRKRPCDGEKPGIEQSFVPEYE